MNMTRSRMIRGLTATAAVLVVGVGAVQGQTFEGSTSAVFGEPQADSNDVFSGVGTDTFNSGEGQSNRFEIGGTPFSTSVDSPFEVLDLTYFNRENPGNTNVDSAEVELTLDFTDPAGLSETFDFDFDLEVTDNTNNDPILDADTLTPINLEDANSTIQVDGEDLTLRLLGFSTDGGATLVDEFVLPENSEVESELFATITAPNSPTPEPTLIPTPAALPAGLVLLGGVLMRRRRGARA